MMKRPVIFFLSFNIFYTFHLFILLCYGDTFVGKCLHFIYYFSETSTSGHVFSPSNECFISTVFYFILMFYLDFYNGSFFSMDVHSPFIFLRIVAFPFSLWILLRWVPILLLRYLFHWHSASIWLGCWWWAHFCVRFPGSWSVFAMTLVVHSEGKTQLLQLVLAVFVFFFRVCRIGMDWCWVGYFGC